MMQAYNYFRFREYICEDLRLGIAKQSIEGIADRVQMAANLTRFQAVDFTDRFFNDLKRRTDRS